MSAIEEHFAALDEEPDVEFYAWDVRRADSGTVLVRIFLRPEQSFHWDPGLNYPLGPLQTFCDRSDGRGFQKIGDVWSFDRGVPSYLKIYADGTATWEE